MPPPPQPPIKWDALPPSVRNRLIVQLTQLLVKAIQAEKTARRTSDE